MALAHVEFDATDESGNLLSNVQARVELEGGGLVSIYSDRAGSTPYSNPQTFADGKISFYVAGGAYKITLTSGAFSRVLRYKANGLLQEKDAVTAAAVAFTPAGGIAAATVQAAIEELDSEKLGGTVGSTDNAVPRANGTGGRTLQSSGVTIDDNNSISGIGALLEQASDTFTESYLNSYADAATASQVGRRSRGNAASKTIVANADFLFSFFARGYDGSAFINGAGIRFRVDGTPALNNVPTGMEFYVNSGAANFSLAMRIEKSGSLQMGSSNDTVITAARHLQLRSYTVATLPSAATAGQLIYVSNGTTNKRLAVSDGTNWRFPDGNVVS